MPVALKGVFDCLKVWKAMWRRVTVEGGMECVFILGTTRMPLWCAENWDILQQVCVHDNYRCSNPTIIP